MSANKKLISLSPKSYRCLSWNSENAKTIDLMKKTHSSLEILSKLKSIDKKTSIAVYDQEATEDKYRRMDIVNFRFNPKNYSVDCEHTAQIIHRKLLRIVGNDNISINDPTYFDHVWARSKLKYQIGVSTAEKAREKQELQRIQLENFILQNGKGSEIVQKSQNRMILKFHDESKDKTSKDCRTFSYDDSSCCVTSIMSDDESQKLRHLRIDSLDDFHEVDKLFSKAQKYINKGLFSNTLMKSKAILEKKEPKINPTNYKELTKDQTKLMNKNSKKVARAQARIDKARKSSLHVQKAAGCGCGKKKK